MPTIEPVEPGIYQSLATFLSHSGTDNEPVELIHQWFRLWWEENPAFQPEMKRGWVLSEKDAIVGFVGNLPSNLLLAGRPATAYSATTWRVLPEYRNQTLGLIFQWMALGKSAVLFATTPTQDVVKILQTMRFRLLPPADDYSTSVLVLSSRSVIAAMGGDNPLAEFAGLLGGAAADQVQKFRSRKIHSADTEPVRRFCQADTLFDQLWERTKDLYANTNMRTSSWINWYCFHPPNAGKFLLGYVQDDRLRAYAICQPKRHEKLKLLECADFWGEANMEDTMPALLHAIERQARQDGYDLVIFPHFTRAYGAALESLGLTTRKFSLKTNYFKPQAGAEVTEQNSYFVSAQGDYGLT
jgi:hypothetical protein